MAELASLIFLESPALCRIAFRPKVIARNVLVFLEVLTWDILILHLEFWIGTFPCAAVHEITIITKLTTACAERLALSKHITSFFLLSAVFGTFRSKTVSTALTLLYFGHVGPS